MSTSVFIFYLQKRPTSSSDVEPVPYKKQRIAHERRTDKKPVITDITSIKPEVKSLSPEVKSRSPDFTKVKSKSPDRPRPEVKVRHSPDSTTPENMDAVRRPDQTLKGKINTFHMIVIMSIKQLGNR